VEGKDYKAPNRIPGLSVYLGPEPERTQRLAALKRISDQLHVTTSQMFRMLADGQLSLIVTPPKVATSVQHNDDEKSG
jgi:hypothetical protein